MASGAPTRAPTIRYVRVEDPRPGAALRSLAVPGWGQMHKGDRTRGAALGAAWGVGLAGTLGAHLARRDARSAYLEAATPEAAADLYPAYNRWQKTRAAFAIGTGVVWAVAVVDALASGAPQGPDSGIAVTPGGLSLRVGL